MKKSLLALLSAAALALQPPCPARDLPHGAQIRHGDLVRVTLEMETNAPLENAVILDLLPGGFEIENGKLATRQATTEPVDSPKGFTHLTATHQEMREDRFLFFGIIPYGKHFVSYNLRAVAKGDYLLPAARLEDMYNPDLSATSENGLRVQVK